MKLRPKRKGREKSDVVVVMDLVLRIWDFNNFSLQQHRKQNQVQLEEPYRFEIFYLNSNKLILKKTQTIFIMFFFEIVVVWFLIFLSIIPALSFVRGSSRLCRLLIFFLGATTISTNYRSNRIIPFCMLCPEKKALIESLHQIMGNI